MAAEKRDIKQAYLNGDPLLAEFAAWPWPIKDFSPVIQGRTGLDVPRQLLVEELLAQNQHLPQSELVLNNIRSLASEQTLTVTTGHQVCLLGGPMFTLYKIATTIALAKQLSTTHPERRFVPVLWMATEDHDWEEVNHFYTQFGTKLTYEGRFQGPVGRHVFDESITGLVATLPEVARSCYAPGVSMAEAFRSLMHRLFGRHGLVIIDADRPALKAHFVRQMQLELDGAGMATPARATSHKLETLGFKAQIFPRDINLFYIGDGRRTLIDRTETGYQLKDGSKQWDDAAIQAEMHAHPEHFSPNVALRPLYQESLLPNVAFVGGWAEISYWLQLKDGFANANVPFPPLIPRLHATLVSRDQAEQLEELGIPLQLIAAPLHVINDAYLDAHWDDSPFTQGMIAVEEAFATLTKFVDSIDPTLAAVVRAEQAKSGNALEGLQKKLRKAMRNRNPLPYQRIAQLKNAIEPENSQQQRVLNFTAFDQIDPLSLVDLLVKNAEIGNAEAKWIVLP